MYKRIRDNFLRTGPNEVRTLNRPQNELQDFDLAGDVGSSTQSFATLS